MARRYGNPWRGAKYLGNSNTKEIHDLDLETPQCQIGKIVAAGHGLPFTSLAVAHALGYDDCAWCLGPEGSER
ncbi:MAG: hypothetical protein AAFY88_15180 [Acidobacteriota bacterium]